MSFGTREVQMEVYLETLAPAISEKLLKQPAWLLIYCSDDEHKTGYYRQVQKSAKYFFVSSITTPITLSHWIQSR